MVSARQSRPSRALSLLQLAGRHRQRCSSPVAIDRRSGLLQTASFARWIAEADYRHMVLGD
jgi:hypothetical protein